MSQESENINKLKTFFDKEYHALKSYVGSRIRESIHLNAEDILQDVALKLFSGASNYSPINNVANFVYRSLKNKIIDSLRKGNSSLFSEEISDLKIIELMDVLYGKPDNSYSENMKEKLITEIMRLKPIYRDIIITIDFEGYTYKDIQLETGESLGTLMSRRHRALGILFKKLNTKK